ncbi:MAG: hypothetical protein E7496_11575 [Ruminococcus sp.]|nr:hypothetical protein [Ruminococcus sp.]
MEKVTPESYREYLTKNLETLKEMSEYGHGTAGDLEIMNQIHYLMKELYCLDFGSAGYIEAGIELSCPMQKEELLEDFSTEELVRELEKRGSANIHRTDDRKLFTFTGNFYTD